MVKAYSDRQSDADPIGFGSTTLVGNEVLSAPDCWDSFLQTHYNCKNCFFFFSSYYYLRVKSEKCAHNFTYCTNKSRWRKRENGWCTIMPNEKSLYLEYKIEKARLDFFRSGARPGHLPDLADRFPPTQAPLLHCVTHFSLISTNPNSTPPLRDTLPVLLPDVMSS